MNNIGVSICIFSYNYEKYISYAIESVLKQKTNFPIEIVIGDDCSTDQSSQIILAYQEKYPDIIKPILNKENIGGTRNWINTINQCAGKYIAFLDGDDYFTDPYKLQKQYDCLEGDPKFVLCFHGVEEKYDDIEGQDSIIRFNKTVYTIDDFLQNGWFIRTSTTFYRNNILPKEPPDWVYRFPYRYDTILHVLLTQFGNAIYIDEVMSIWRKHVKGVSRILMSDTIKNIQTEIAMSQQLSHYTSFKYDSIVKKYCANLYVGLFTYLLQSKSIIMHMPLLVKSFVKMNKFVFIEKIIKKINL